MKKSRLLSVLLTLVLPLVVRAARAGETIDTLDGHTRTLEEGEILIEHTRPTPGVTYVGNGQPRGPRKDRKPSPKS